MTDAFVETTWTDLAGGDGHPDGDDRPGAPAATFDPDSVAELPEPARRLLANALPAGAPLATGVEVTMSGQIKLGRRWLAYTAEQILRAGVGFVWSPTVGGRLLRFTGADALGPDGARMEFRLHGRLPVVRASGPDVVRSAQGRLAAETVAWLPHALTPQAGARWAPIDDERAVVTVVAAGRPVEVEVVVDAAGRLRGLELDRWRDSAKPPGLARFGGSIDRWFTTADGVTLAGGGTVGWDRGTAGQDEGVFFRYTITSARFLDRA